MPGLARDNPFTERNTIKNLDEFFGRKDELRTIFTRLKGLQNTSIYGDRKIGKSSLLYYVFNKIPEELGSNYEAIYIDLQNPNYHIACDFLRNILTKMECDPKVILENNTDDETQNRKIYHKNLSAFSTSIEEIKSKHKFVLIIDGFEHIIRKPQEFNKDFFDTLKVVGESENIAYLTASLHSLKDLFIENKLTSTYYGIFSELKLGEFTRDETSDFLNSKRKGVNFNADEIKLIKEVAGNNPLYLRITCDHIFANKGKRWNRNKIKDEIVNELKYYKPKNEIKEKDRKVRLKKFGNGVYENMFKLIELVATVLKHFY